MKILKHGNLKPMKFVCDQCNCEFVANATEYRQYKYDGAVLWIYADCPECNTRINYGEPWEEENENY